MMFTKRKLMRDLAVTNYIMQKYDISFTVSLEDVSSDFEISDLELFDEFEEEY
ncbi:MAG: hypothetical protein QW331_04555 [Candidatus Woesearchaeota archaeon]